MFFRLVVTIMLICAVSACSSVMQAPHPTEASQPTIEPLFTKVPVTTTFEPENVATFTPIPKSNSARGTPIPVWENVPVMSGAIEGWFTSYSYVYSINMAVEEAEQFYTEKMQADGWNLIYRQTSPTSASGNPIISLNFRRNKEDFNIILVYNKADDFMHISLTLVKP